MNESIDNLVAYQPSPDALAEISVETNNYSADTGNVAGAVISNVIKSGTNQFHGQRLRVLPQQQDGRELVVEQPLERRQAGAHGRTSSAARSAGRSSRTRCSSSPTTRGRGSTRRARRRISVAPEAWRRGDLSSVTATIRDPRTGQAVRGQPDSGGPDQPDRPRASSATRRSTRCRTATVGGVTGNYVGDTLQTITRQPGRRARRLERVGERQDLRALLDRRVPVKRRQAGHSAAARQQPGRAVPQPGVQLEPHLQLVARQRAARRLQPDHDRRATRSTGPASATATRPSGSPAGSRFRA